MFNYKKSIARANKYSESYYHSKQLVSDSEFDALMETIRKYEKTHTPLKSSPTQRVGSDLTRGFKKVVHNVPMLSLGKVLNLDELEDWLHQAHLKVNSKFTLEYKMDGCSLSLIYRKGVLVRAATRGTGIKGDDVTVNSSFILGIPHKLPLKLSLEIRGEVIFLKSEFKKALKRGEELKNCRNTASGALKLHSISELKKKKLHFFAYTVLGGEKTQYGDIKLLRKLGFTTVLAMPPTNNMNKIIRVCDRMDLKRDKLDFDIDGMVVKINIKSEQKKMGSTSVNPKYAIAYKFPNKVVEPRLNDVELQVGRTGAITPVAVYDPMLLCGTTVERASLHNFDMIKKLGVRIGDTVSVVKRGEIIPQVVSVVSKGSNRKKIVVPRTCPCCGKRVRFIGKKLYCTNDYCSAKVVGNIVIWCSKPNMNIDGVSVATIGALNDCGIVNNVCDLYKLTKKKLLSIEGIQEKSAVNILNSINRSKTSGLSKVISGLCINTIGNTIAEELAGKFKSLKKLSRATKSELMSIETIAEVKAKNIVAFFKANRKLISELYKIDGLILDEKKVHRVSNKLHGKVFCITGTLSLGRTDFQSLIVKNGGKAVSSITSKTRYLIAGVGGGSKLNKAEKLGVKVISESDFHLMIK